MNQSHEKSNLDQVSVENPQDEYSQYSESESEHDSSGSDSGSSSGTGTSNQSIDAEWARFIDEDGSLTYIESYVSSTVKERQVHQAIKAATEYERKSPFLSPPKNLKRHTKLLSLLKRRPSVRVKSSSSSSNPPEANRGGGGGGEPSSASSPPKVTFRDNPSGEVRHVSLRVTEMGLNYGRRASFCETVLGVMPGRFNEPPDTRVMVAGLAPGSLALKEGSIKIGDWLKSLNGLDVTWENLDATLMEVRIPSTVTLSVQKCAAETLPQDDLHHLKRITQTRLVMFVTGKEKKSAEWNAMVEKGTLPLHTVLHLSLEGVTEESPDKSDIRYQFPSMTNKLVQVRGMFLTLSHSLQDVVGSPVVSSTATLHGVHYHAAFCRDGHDVFLIVLPHFCLSEADLVNLMEQVCKLIRFEFGLLASGLSDPKHKDYLDHLFLLILEDVLTLEEGVAGGSPLGVGYGAPFTPAGPPHLNYACAKSRFLCGAPSLLVLRDEFAKIQLEICLNELQSGDFGDNNSDCEDCLLLYNIVGCSIFYKGHLVLSHLCPDSAESVFLFLERHRLLLLSEREPLSQLVLWRRVFPPLQGGEEGADTPFTGGEVDHYLLIVAMNHFLLATLVESGNVTQLMEKDAGPDPFLVDQAETTLYHLHSLHVHTACEESLLSNAIETMALDAKLTASPSRKNSKGKPGTSAEGSPARIPDVPSILKQKTPPPPSPLDAPPSSPSVGEYEGSDDSHSHSPSSKDSSLKEGEGGEEHSKEEGASDSDWRIWKGPEGRIGHAYNHEGSSPFAKGQRPPPLRVTVGEEKVLLHLMQLDAGEGIIVTSSPEDPAPPLQAQLVRNFYAAVSHIRHMLQTGRRNKGSEGSYSAPASLNSLKEYGILFECQPVPGKGKTTLAYWVLGRFYGPPYEREIFVALEDSIAQNVQEIAFKVALGCS